MVVDTASAPGVVGAAAEDKDGPSDDDPGPSFFFLIIEREDWHALGDVEAVVARAYAACTESIAAIAGREVSIVLSTDDAVAALNARYRGENHPTNVLSFPAADFSVRAPSSAARSALGDIIIAYETAIREAGEEGKPPLHHLSHLTVHGLLHLAGFDHQTDEDAERMERLEREILAGIGIPDPYSLTSDATPAGAG